MIDRWARLDEMEFGCPFACEVLGGYCGFVDGRREKTSFVLLFSVYVTLLLLLIHHRFLRDGI